MQRGAYSTFLPEVGDPIVNDGAKIPDRQSADQSICEPNEAAHEGHPVADEVLA